MKWHLIGILGLAGMLAGAATRPGEGEVARAERMVREVFAREYAAGAEGRAELARKLLEQAEKTENDAAARFVLLREARDLAAAAVECETCGSAIRHLARGWGLDAAEMTLGAMKSAAWGARTAEGHAAIARTCLDAMDGALGRDDFGLAGRLLEMANGAAMRAKNVEMLGRCRVKERELAAMRGEYEGFAAAKERLARDGGNEEANGQVGRFLCMVKGDWEAGLSFLAKGSDAGLRALAQRDLGKPADFVKRFELGTEWWDLGEQQRGAARKNLRARGAHWYRLALPGLNGLQREAAAKRVENFDREWMAELGYRPGLKAELFKGTEFGTLVKTRIDAAVDFDWGMEAVEEGMPKDNFSIRWSGVIKPAIAGQYELVAVANTGARVWIDGKLVVDGPMLSRSRSGMRVAVELTAEPHAVRIEYWDSSGIARMRLMWRGPDEDKERVVPPAVWFHGE